MSIDWKRKLASRKFWALLAGLATSALVLANVPENTITQVVAVIGAFGSIVGYMLAEAYVDGQAAGKSVDNST
jgi:hypothetical protein